METTEESEDAARPLFFSYSHDDRDRAAAIIKALEQAGHIVWWDDHLEGGSAYSSSIEKALDAAGAVIVLWSESSIQSHWVSDEAEQGRARECLVPLTIDGVKPPLGFRQLQIIDMNAWRGAADAPEFQRLLRAIATCSGVDAPPRPASVTTPAWQSGAGLNRRNLFIAGGAAATVGALGIGGISLFGGRSGLVKNGVAVLPFRNLSGDPAQDYLSIGLSSEVRTVLARNTALRVVAQASSEAVKERALGAAEMAKALAVSFLLDGNVRQAGDRLHVAAELIDGRTGFSQWSQVFERPIGELATVQDAIADAVTIELAIDRSAVSAVDHYGATANAAAFNDYLKGKDLYAAALSLETDLASLDHFDRAIERDPQFGAAHAARARILTVLGNTSDDVVKARLYYETAQAAATRAVEAGPDSADAHSTLGYVLFQAQLNVAEARGPYERSYELGRGEATTLARYAAYAAATKEHAKAMRAVTAARDLDPLNAGIHRADGFVHYAAGNFAASIEAVGRALALNPELSDAHARIGMALIVLDRPDEALAAAQKEKSGMMRYPCLAIANHLLGNQDGADAAMAELIKTYGEAGLYQQAQVLSQWNQPEEALKVLKRAFELGDSGLTYLFIDPAMDPLRKHADFNLLLKALGFA